MRDRKVELEMKAVTKTLVKLISPVMIAALATTPALAKKPAPARELGVDARIAFPDTNIRNFEADGRNGLYIQDARRNWYYATLDGSCLDLPQAITLGFETRGISALDTGSYVLAKGPFGVDRCMITDLVTSAAPPTKAEKKAKRQAEKAAKKAKSES